MSPTASLWIGVRTPISDHIAFEASDKHRNGPADTSWSQKIDHGTFYVESGNVNVDKHDQTITIEHDGGATVALKMSPDGQWTASGVRNGVRVQTIDVGTFNDDHPHVQECPNKEGYFDIRVTINTHSGHQPSGAERASFSIGNQQFFAYRTPDGSLHVNVTDKNEVGPVYQQIDLAAEKDGDMVLRKMLLEADGEARFNADDPNVTAYRFQPARGFQGFLQERKSAFLHQWHQLLR